MSDGSTIEVDGTEYEYDAAKPWRDADLLEELYWEEGMSQREIADVIDCGSTTIGTWMDKHDLDSRPSPSELPPYFRTHKGYERWDHEHDGTNTCVCVHRLLAVAEYGFDKVVGDEVHHKNNISWDNRPDNIELMETSEHVEHHMDERYGDSPWRDEERLRELYCEKKMSSLEIAKKFDCDDLTVRNWLDKYDIEQRSRSEAQKLRHEENGDQTLELAE